jgi:DMSO/TMAO reductase YedYZ molybdopterin-dependent catalytic subunit
MSSAASRLAGWRDREAADPRRSERSAALLGLALGVSFGICFLTGVLSHLIQHPPGWFTWVPRPAGLYRVTQGLHVATGIAAIPLLLAKLWTVAPKLLQSPAIRNLPHALERLSLVPLVGGSIFLLVTGVANVDLWYPWPFFFPSAHYWVAWITIGALVVHIGAKLPVARRALRRSRPEPPEEAVTRRRFLLWAGTGSAVLTAVTVGQTVAPLRSIALLAPRRPDRGDQGFPVNKTAIEASVVEPARSPGYRLRIEGAVPAPVELTLDELRSLPQRAATLPIACVEGWSASPRWSGVPLRDLVRLAGGDLARGLTVVSLEPAGLYSESEVNHLELADADALLALAVEGRTLSLDHGYPARLIGPNRPGVLQTKWVTRIVVR